MRALEPRLRDVGFLGPLGIDAFVYRDATGRARLKPVVEINPRNGDAFQNLSVAYGLQGRLDDALAAAQSALDRRIIVLFQPHRYSRTAHLLDQFGPAFLGADDVVLTDIPLALTIGVWAGLCVVSLRG